MGILKRENIKGQYNALLEEGLTLTSSAVVSRVQISTSSWLGRGCCLSCIYKARTVARISPTNVCNKCLTIRLMYLFMYCTLKLKHYEAYTRIFLRPLDSPKTDSSTKRTPRVAPCWISLEDGHVLLVPKVSVDCIIGDKADKVLVLNSSVYTKNPSFIES